MLIKRIGAYRICKYENYYRVFKGRRRIGIDNFLSLSQAEEYIKARTSKNFK